LGAKGTPPQKKILLWHFHASSLHQSSQIFEIHKTCITYFQKSTIFTLLKKLIMALDITGSVIHKLNKTEGVSKAGKPWSKQEFVIETQEQYPRKVCMSVMNEKVSELERINIGDVVKASLNIESREYQGRWYTDVRAWKIEMAGASQSTSSGPSHTNYETPAHNESPADSTTDDLPF
jgi:hypothetical protein